MRSPIEMILWSIAFPGFGQILNGRILKGALFIGLEFLINVKANINEAIVLSFNGHIIESIKATNYEWVMFYPCIYTFSIWDAYKDARGNNSGYSFLPAVFGAYFGTLGVVFSRETISMAVLLGPIWFGILGMITGVAIGLLLKVFITNSTLIRSLMRPSLVRKKNN